MTAFRFSVIIKTDGKLFEMTKLAESKFKKFISVLKEWQKINKTRSTQEVIDQCIFCFDEDVYVKVQKFKTGKFPADTPPELLNDFLMEVLGNK